MRSAVLDALGGEKGCRRLSAAFYSRVGKDPALQSLFPGKSLRCATQEFAAFLIQFLGGDDKQTQYRWWLSLRESHARFQISATQRSAWLKHMGAALDAHPLDEETRTALRHFFVPSSAYVTGKESDKPQHQELAARWAAQRALDNVIGAIAAGRDQEALAHVPQFASRPSVFTGLLERMTASRRPALIDYVTQALQHDPALSSQQFAGRTLLHFASGAGCIEVVSLLLRLGANPNVEDKGGHTPLYWVANGCSFETGAEVVRALIVAGADVNASGGVMHATPLHMAARRGHLQLAQALLDSGAALEARDRNGVTPLQRALNCRRHSVAQLLLARGAVPPPAH